MRAILRGATVLLAGAAWLAAGTAFAQDATPAATTNQPAGSNTPATDSIGPRELQNFSLPGTATRPAEQSRTAPPAASAVSPPVPSQQTAAAPPTGERRAPPRRVATQAVAAVPPAATPAVSQLSAPVAAPPIPSESAPAEASQSAPAPFTSAPVAAATGTLAPQHGLSILPWLIAALVLAAGTIVLLWRRRPRRALVAGPQFDLFAAPDPQPEPRPQPPPEARRVSPPTPAATRREERGSPGIVASRLRPALEFVVRPLRCLVEDSQVTIEFELELFNAGAAPARAVLAEASMLNASATQEQDLAAFFANPNGVGERLTLIPPMKRVSFRSQVVAPRAAVQEYELAGRKAFVPVIAFNALYEWSGGTGQSSAAYLVGRDTQKEKLGPLRLGEGAREFRGLGARPLPSAVRT